MLWPVAPADVVERRRVYHVSPTVLTPAIQTWGVDPSFANGPLKVSWWCEKQALMWAIAHISAQKSISVDQLSVHCATIYPGALACTVLKHAFTCRYIVMPNKTYPATIAFTWLDPDGTFKNG